MQVSKHYVRTAQGELHYRRCGESGPVLVLLQILPFATVMFEPLLPLLAQAGLRCVAFDLMGYGRSDKRQGSWTVEDFAENIDEGIRALALEPAFLLGGHFAGMVAAMVALRRPGLRRLVLDGTPVWPADYRANLVAELGVKPFTVTADGQFAMDCWNQVMMMMNLLSPGFEVTAATAPRLRDFTVQLMETTYGPSVVPAMAGFDMSLVLPKLAVETLVLTSEGDSQVKYFPVIMAGIRGAVGQVFPGVHPMHDIGRPERVSEYADTLTKFLLAA
jgi:pimeloyl-ACP methyl ester carboxylesterase